MTHGFATHYNMDHAGAAQDLKNKGMRLIVTQEHVTAVPAMKQWERTFGVSSTSATWRLAERPAVSRRTVEFSFREMV